jgi:hypothetical protein
MLTGNGSSVSSSGSANDNLIWIGQIPAASATANIFGSTVIDIIDPFSTTKNKTVRSIDGYSTSNLFGLFSGAWINTSSIQTMTLFAEAGNLVSGSRFSLYGIKG